MTFDISDIMTEANKDLGYEQNIHETEISDKVIYDDVLTRILNSTSVIYSSLLFNEDQVNFYKIIQVINL